MNPPQSLCLSICACDLSMYAPVHGSLSLSVMYKSVPLPWRIYTYHTPTPFAKVHLDRFYLVYVRFVSNFHALPLTHLIHQFPFSFTKCSSQYLSLFSPSLFLYHFEIPMESSSHQFSTQNRQTIGEREERGNPEKGEDQSRLFVLFFLVYLILILLPLFRFVLFRTYSHFCLS